MNGHGLTYMKNKNSQIARTSSKKVNKEVTYFFKTQFISFFRAVFAPIWKDAACSLYYFFCFFYTLLLTFVLDLKRKIFCEILKRMFVWWFKKQNKFLLFLWRAVLGKLGTFMDTIFNFCTTSKYFSCDTKLF